jgi:hypothetical protein
MVRVHYTDELRHAELLQACADSVGPTPIPAPSNLNMPHRLEQALGGLVASFMESSCGVFEVYAFLEVLEERAVREYPAFVEALETVDARSAEALRQVIRDEQRHVGYARAIARQYAPDPSAYEQTITRYRAVESTVFEEQQRDFTLFLLERGLLGLSAIEDALLRTTVTAASSFGGARGHRAADRSAKPRPSF